MRFRSCPVLGTGILLCVSLAGCTGSSSAQVAAEASGTTALPDAAATVANGTAQPAAGISTTAAPDCLAGTAPVEDASRGRGRVCHGAIPSYFAAVMTRLTQTSPDGKGAWPIEDRDFTVIPGFGRRADIMVGGGPWIRSFEGADPAITVYVIDGEGCEAGSRGSDSCKYGMRAFQVVGNAAPVDVTAQLLPDAPVLSDKQREHYEELGGGDLWLDTSKLSLVPTMRWLMEFDPDRPLPTSDPHDAGGIGHFGFVAWNGQRFELKDRVPRSQWPCYPVSQGSRPCASDYPDQDRFIINGK